jgi:hypothetical protein
MACLPRTIVGKRRTAPKDELPISSVCAVGDEVVLVDLYSAFSQQLVNIAIRLCITEIPAHCQHDHFPGNRKPVNVDGDGRTGRTRQMQRMRLSMPNDIFPLCNSPTSTTTASVCPVLRRRLGHCPSHANQRTATTLSGVASTSE